jgi:hypothetical protein
VYLSLYPVYLSQDQHFLLFHGRGCPSSNRLVGLSPRKRPRGSLLAHLPLFIDSAVCIRSSFVGGSPVLPWLFLVGIAGIYSSLLRLILIEHVARKTSESSFPVTLYSVVYDPACSVVFFRLFAALLSIMISPHPLSHDLTFCHFAFSSLVPAPYQTRLKKEVGDFLKLD